MTLLTTKDYKTFVVGEITFRDYKLANRCLPGDDVTFDDTGCSLVKRANYGYIVGTLELNSKYKYGHTAKGYPLYLFTPHNRSYPQLRVGSSEKDTSKNTICLVEFLDWNAADHLPRGNLVKVLGHAGTFHVEAEALKWLYGCPSLKKEKDLTLGISNFLNRPLLEGITINIDPPGCRDIDDVITMKQIKEGLWNFAITIADVAEWVSINSDLDLEARKKGQTLYQNGTAVLPMFPLALSEDEASLLPSKTRLGVSLLFQWNAEQETLSNVEWKETQIKNHMSHTYESILQTRPFGFSVEGLKTLCSHLKGSETGDPHEWVEELMLFYNKQAARLLLPYREGLLRTHSGADKELLERWIRVNPTLEFLAYQAATYELIDTTRAQVHIGLGSVPYCHASSPLRRYADLVNQRCIKAILRKEIPPYTELDLAQHLNQCQAQAKKHDRDYIFLRQLLLYNYDTHEQLGIVLSILEDKMKVKVYVVAWKRVVSVKYTESIYKPGDQVILEYYSDMKRVGWKDRMVFRLRLFTTEFTSI